MKTGIELIAEERKRQLEKCGWTSEHDDNETDDQLANAAATYAIPAWTRSMLVDIIGSKDITGDICPTWPWDPVWWKPSPNDRIKELSKAGALIAAEIDRLQRASVNKANGLVFLEDVIDWLEEHVNDYIVNDNTNPNTGEPGKDWFKVKSECFNDLRKAVMKNDSEHYE